MDFPMTPEELDRVAKVQPQHQFYQAGGESTAAAAPIGDDPFLAVGESNAELDFNLDDLSDEEGEFGLLPELDLLSSCYPGVDSAAAAAAIPMVKDLDGVHLPADPESFDRLLAAEMEQLSVQEKESLWYEVHGIADPIEETPVMISEALKDFERLLLTTEHSTPPGKNVSSPIDAYLMAKSVDKNFAEDPKLRLQFIRATGYKIEESIKRYLKHFTEKLDLFGREKLCKEILWNDLGKLDQESVMSGAQHVLRERDLAGRAVICIFPVPLPHMTDPSVDFMESIKSRLRSMWYIFTKVLRDEDVQRNGIVGAVMMLGATRILKEYHYLTRLNSVRYALPHRIMGIHVCTTNSFAKKMTQFVVWLGGKQLRSRYRAHCFTKPEGFKHALSTFGIPIQHIPEFKFDEDAGTFEYLTTVHQEWVDNIRKEEESNRSTGTIIGVPRRFDVLFGRSSLAKTHVGNLRAVHLVEMHRRQYESAGKTEKTEISKQIVELVHRSGGRFIEPRDGSFIEVDDLQARKKIAHFFRRLRAERPLEPEDEKKNDAIKAAGTRSLDMPVEEDSKCSREKRART